MVQLPVLLLPGWQNSDADHWQSHWERAFGDTRVIQHDWDCPLRGDWIMRLEEALLAANAPVLLAAHSLGCHAVAAWAAHSGQTHRVRAALLVAPPDCARDDLPAALHSWRKPVLNPLPFASTVMASSNDPYASMAASEQMSAAWGGTLRRLGALGHVNSESRLGLFPEGRQELSKLEQSH